jgi:hypothetical protein
MADAMKHPHLAPFRMLGTPQGTCPECAVKHEAGQPHNARSLAYQYDFYGKHGRWPTWADAVAHCAAEIQSAWKAELTRRGVWTEAPPCST